MSVADSETGQNTYRSSARDIVGGKKKETQVFQIFPYLRLPKVEAPKTQTVNLANGPRSESVVRWSVLCPCVFPSLGGKSESEGVVLSRII